MTIRDQVPRRYDYENPVWTVNHDDTRRPCEVWASALSLDPAWAARFLAGLEER